MGTILNRISNILEGDEFQTNYNNIKLVGNYAIICVENRTGGSALAGIRVYDISDKYNPTRVCFVNIPNARRFYIDGNYAYVADSVDRLKIYDISDPENVTYCGGASGGSGIGATDVFAYNNIAYTASHTGKVSIAAFSVTNKNNPVYIRETTSPSIDARVFCTDGTHIYTSAFFAGIAVYNQGLDGGIVKLITPESLSVRGFESGVFIKDNLLFVNYQENVTNSTGVLVIDVSNINNPVLVTKKDLDLDQLYNLSIADCYLFTCSYQRGVSLIDITDIHDMQIKAQTENYAALESNYTFGYIYAVESKEGFSIYEIVNADFYGEPLSGTVPFVVNFYPVPSNLITYYLWDFGDGLKSTDAYPTHKYFAPGIYDVTLYIEFPGGNDTITKQQYIRAIGPRHYPRMRQLGNYDDMFPLLSKDSNFHIDLRVKARQLDIVDDEAIVLHPETFPDSTTLSGLLLEWETLCGLDHDEALSLDERRNAVVAVLVSRGGMSKIFFKAVSEKLGYTYGSGSAQPRIWFVEGGQYLPFRADFSKAGDQVWDATTNTHDHVVEIWGSGIASNTVLINLFSKYRPKGIRFVYRSE